MLIPRANTASSRTSREPEHTKADKRHAHTNTHTYTSGAATSNAFINSEMHSGICECVVVCRCMTMFVMRCLARATCGGTSGFVLNPTARQRALNECLSAYDCVPTHSCITKQIFNEKPPLLRSNYLVLITRLLHEHFGNYYSSQCDSIRLGPYVILITNQTQL